MQDNHNVLHIKVAAVFPGVLISGTIVLAATWLAQHYNTPVMLFALLLGMAFRFLHKDGRCIVGIEFSSKSLLRVGVGLLGARITIAEIAYLGVGPLLIVDIAVVSTIAFAWNDAA
jgi:uncharacterized membrane protein YadS